MDRRAFLRSTSLALAGGLVVGDAAMELYERLTHRKVWALGAVPRKRTLDELLAELFEKHGGGRVTRDTLARLA